MQRLNPLLKNTQALLLHWRPVIKMWVSALGTADYASQVKEVNTKTLPRGAEDLYISKANQHMWRLNANIYPPSFV